MDVDHRCSRWWFFGGTHSRCSKYSFDGVWWRCGTDRWGSSLVVERHAICVSLHAIATTRTTMCSFVPPSFAPSRYWKRSPSRSLSFSCIESCTFAFAFTFSLSDETGICLRYYNFSSTSMNRCLFCVEDFRNSGLRIRAKTTSLMALTNQLLLTKKTKMTKKLLEVFSHFAMKWARSHFFSRSDSLLFICLFSFIIIYVFILFLIDSYRRWFEKKKHTSVELFFLLFRCHIFSRYDLLCFVEKFPTLFIVYRRS